MFEHNHIPELVAGDPPRQGARRRSSSRATVTDASGNVVELKNLRPDGTIGEPADEADATGCGDRLTRPADETGDDNGRQPGSPPRSTDPRPRPPGSNAE